MQCTLWRRDDESIMWENKHENTPGCAQEDGQEAELEIGKASGLLSLCSFVIILLTGSEEAVGSSVSDAGWGRGVTLLSSSQPIFFSVLGLREALQGGYEEGGGGGVVVRGLLLCSSIICCVKPGQ